MLDMHAITTHEGSITSIETDAIVCPAHSLGYMGSGAALAIKKAGGQAIEDEVVAAAPLELGGGLITTAGALPCKAVIHAPTILQPSDLPDDYHIALAVRGALLTADDAGFTSIAFPGMGAGHGKMRVDTVASTMVKEIEKFRPRSIKKIILVDINPQMVEAWDIVLGRH